MLSINQCKDLRANFWNLLLLRFEQTFFSFSCFLVGKIKVENLRQLLLNGCHR